MPLRYTPVTHCTVQKRIITIMISGKPFYVYYGSFVTFKEFSNNIIISNIACEINELLNIKLFTYFVYLLQLYYLPYIETCKAKLSKIID